MARLNFCGGVPKVIGTAKWYRMALILPCELVNVNFSLVATQTINLVHQTQTRDEKGPTVEDIAIDTGEGNV